MSTTIRLSVPADDLKRYWLQMFYSAVFPPIRKLGSLNSLDLRRIQDGTLNMDIIREWTWYAYKDLKFGSSPPGLKYNDYFIPDFMTTCTLAHDLDFGNAVNFVRETELYRAKELPACLTRDGVFSVVHDLIEFLRYESPYALRKGHEFMRYVRQCVCEKYGCIIHRPQPRPLQ